MTGIIKTLAPRKYYIIYDSAEKKILGTSSKVDDNYISIEIDSDLNRKIALKEYTFDNLKVVYNAEDEVYRVVVIKNLVVVKFDVDKSIHAVSDTNSPNSMIIKQYPKQGKWVFETDFSNKFIDNASSYFVGNKEIYITQKNNPNILIGTLRIPLDDIIEHPYTLESETAELIDISLYTGIFAEHESYTHKVIYDE